MASTLTWLDSSAEEQRRMRELLNLFTDSDTLDDLGFGQIRDTISDLLFPGTSTLLTRARYLVIVPWCYMLAERRGLAGARFLAQVERYEREFIKWMRDAGSPPGLIGRVSGPAVKTLPSSLYAGALSAYGIRVADEPTAERAGYDGIGELTGRHLGMWQATTPPPPPEFPRHLAGGLDLTREEAAWIAERILDTQRETLLGQLLLSPDSVTTDSAAPWADPAVSHVSAEVQRQLGHARQFSGAIHGAQLLYNLMVAEEYEKAGFNAIEGSVESYRDLVQEWSAEVQNDPAYRQWDRDDLWSMLIEANARISSNVTARQFVAIWLDAVVSGEAFATEGGKVGSARLRHLVADRERFVKHQQARLDNAKRLKTWSGSSGAGRLVFRWPQVRRILGDIQTGLGQEAPDAAS